jgi:hypothetical protein
VIAVEVICTSSRRSHELASLAVPSLLRKLPAPAEVPIEPGRSRTIRPSPTGYAVAWSATKTSSKFAV